ncbi:hypothetical protein GCM10010910_25290 [Microbacterium nanhaiense]|uniref:Uncharacterized protein n=1 Tax=Microbacterium nanhaiense TaxID=1301026 RepID=A0ABQ2N7S8_9MICO|nr:hypothetical protein GCM10010910_25290 [Microbacterium nanhaiense]
MRMIAGNSLVEARDAPSLTISVMPLAVFSPFAPRVISVVKRPSSPLPAARTDLEMITHCQLPHRENAVCHSQALRTPPT